jgi:Ca2+:H+ antiporter
MGKSSDIIQDKFRSVANSNRHTTRDPTRNDFEGAILPTHNNTTSNTNSNSGGLDEKDGVGYPSASGSDRSGSGDGILAGGRGAPAATGTRSQGGTSSQSTYPTASPTVKSEAARAGDSSVDSADGADTAAAPKPPMTTRTIQASKRFVIHTKNAICHSWINVLLVFVPLGIAAEAAHMSPTIVFALNAVAIVPLAGLLSHATESVASRLGDTVGALLNVTFGNAVELIIFIIALVKNEIRIVQASLLGSILANLLLILGMAFLLGGLRFREQVYNSTVTNMSACLLSLCVMSLLLPVSLFDILLQCSPADHMLRPLSTLRSKKKRQMLLKPRCWPSAVAQVSSCCLSTVFTCSSSSRHTPTCTRAFRKKSSKPSLTPVSWPT